MACFICAITILINKEKNLENIKIFNEIVNHNTSIYVELKNMIQKYDYLYEEPIVFTTNFMMMDYDTLYKEYHQHYNNYKQLLKKYDRT